MRQSRATGRTARRWVVPILTAALVAGAFLSVTGCARRTVVVVDSEGDVVHVQSSPPPAKAEIRPPKPTPGAVWVSGHWKWNGHKYVWLPGHWNKKPGGKSWVGGHWAKKPGGWVWVPGRWH